MGITHSWNGTVLTITSDSGTSSTDLKGSKGDTGVRGAQGAQGIVDYTILDNYLKSIEFNLEPATQASISFSDDTAAIISAVGTSENSYCILSYCGYGSGGANKVHITPLQIGSNITYSIVDENTNDTNGLNITNNDTSTDVTLTINVLHGSAPNVVTSAIVVDSEE